MAPLEAGTAPHMMQGQLPGALCPLDPHFQQGWALNPEIPERFPAVAATPRARRVSWAGVPPLAVPIPLQQQPSSHSAIPMGVLDAQVGSGGCANMSWPHLIPLCLVTRSPGSHTGEGWAAQGSCHVQPCNVSPLSPRSCWAAATESGWRFAKCHPKPLWAAGAPPNAAQPDGEGDSAHSSGVTPAPAPWACSHPL